MFKTVTVEERESRMRSALEALGSGWHDRNELAAHFGKTQLNAADLLTLDVMARAGTIEKGMAPTGLITVSKWQYRIKK